MTIRGWVQAAFVGCGLYLLVTGAYTTASLWEDAFSGNRDSDVLDYTYVVKRAFMTASLEGVLGLLLALTSRWVSAWVLGGANSALEARSLAFGAWAVTGVVGLAVATATLVPSLVIDGRHFAAIFGLGPPPPPAPRYVGAWCAFGLALVVVITLRFLAKRGLPDKIDSTRARATHATMALALLGVGVAVIVIAAQSLLQAVALLVFQDRTHFGSIELRPSGFIAIGVATSAAGLALVFSRRRIASVVGASDAVDKPDFTYGSVRHAAWVALGAYALFVAGSVALQVCILETGVVEADASATRQFASRLLAVVGFALLGAMCLWGPRGVWRRVRGLQPHQAQLDETPISTHALDAAVWACIATWILLLHITSYLVFAVEGTFGDMFGSAHHTAVWLGPPVLSIAFGAVACARGFRLDRVGRLAISVGALLALFAGIRPAAVELADLLRFAGRPDAPSSLIATAFGVALCHVGVPGAVLAWATLQRTRN